MYLECIPSYTNNPLVCNRISSNKHPRRLLNLKLLGAALILSEKILSGKSGECFSPTINFHRR